MKSWRRRVLCLLRLLLVRKSSFLGTCELLFFVSFQVGTPAADTTRCMANDQQTHVSKELTDLASITGLFYFYFLCYCFVVVVVVISFVFLCFFFHFLLNPHISTQEKYITMPLSSVSFPILDNHTRQNRYYLVYLYIFTNPSARVGYDTRSIFKRSLTGLNSEFSFS